MRHLVYPNRIVRTWQRYQRLMANFENWGSLLARKYGLTREGTLLMRTRTGLSIEVPEPLIFTFKDIFLHAAYDLPEIVSTLPMAPTVLDIGANVGYFSLSVLRHRPAATCFAFEPNPTNFASLQRNRQLNPQTAWLLFNEAVAGSEGELELTLPDGLGLSTSSQLVTARPSGGGKLRGQVTRVRAVSLKSIFERERLTSCDWLKMDCEGAEYDVLYSAPRELLQRISAISLEAHRLDEASRNKEALARFLEEAAFEVSLADDDVLHAIRTADR